jgi:hypothetical protein
MPATALTAAETAFAMLTCEPAPLVFDARPVPGMPDVTLPLNDLRGMLVYERYNSDTTDALWRQLARHAREWGPAWVIGAIGVALPALTHFAARISRGYPRLADDIDSEILAAFLQALRSADLAAPRLWLRLCWAAWRAGAAVINDDEGEELPLDLSSGSRTPRMPYGHPDLLLGRAAAAGLIAVMLGAAPPPAERAALDRAITATYHHAGINADPRTWSRPAPLLRDLAEVLAADGDTAAAQLAARLAPWTGGNFASLFGGPSTAAPGGHLVVWSLRHLPDELRTVGTLLALDAIWSGIDAPATSARRRPQFVVVDEAWLLMRDGEGARFLFRMSKAARKRLAGLCVITQDAADVLSTDLGLAVVSNAATQVLMRQSTQSIDAVAEAFNLTAGEARMLLSASRGEGLLVAGRSRIPFRSVGSAAEHRIAVTGIGEVAE